MFAENESATRIRFKIVHMIAKRGKPFTDGSVIKECMMEAENYFTSHGNTPKGSGS